MQNPARQFKNQLSWQPSKALAHDNDKISKFSLRLLPLLTGLIAAQKLNLGGEVYIGEILALAYILFNLGKFKLGKSLRPLLFLGFTWAICQFVSDQVNQTVFLDSAKGVGAPLVFISTSVALSIFFVRDIRRMPSFLFGVYIGLIPEFIFFQSEYFAGNPWKWGVGQFVLGLFSIYFTFFIPKKKTIYLVVFIAVFSVVSLLNDSRSMAIFPAFAVMAYLFLRHRRFGAILNVFRGRFAIAKLAVVIFALLLSINSAFTAFFSSDWVLDKLPEESAEKFKIQAGGEYGVLLGGRNEMLVSIDAFLDKPLLGHGSWAKDKTGYQDKLTALKFALGYSDIDTATYRTDLIPAHSYLMGTLVWAGIGGGLFWIFIIRWLMLEFITHARFLGFYFYIGIIEIMWDIMFSPFGASARWSAAVFIASLYCYTNWTSKTRQ